jgi:uncharacterized tellurite resistance protein B-like protein
MGKLTDLDTSQRKQLVRFVCSIAWADLRLRKEELEFVKRLVRRLEFGKDAEAEVLRFLHAPPEPEEVDPNLIQFEHREIFLDTMRTMIAADLDVSTEERECMQLLEQLLGDD